MPNEIKIQKGSGNVFKDLGLPNPEERLSKAKITSMICDIIEKQEISSEKAGTILGMSEAQMSDLIDGRLEAFSLERLFALLHALDQDVDIIIHPKKRDVAQLTLAYANA